MLCDASLDITVISYWMGYINGPSHILTVKKREVVELPKSLHWFFCCDFRCSLEAIQIKSCFSIVANKMLLVIVMVGNSPETDGTKIVVKFDKKKIE